ncbi:MAG: hypothetical protein ASARMPREDX12_002766 [Alectoria sarmentosa]|nr:MAG: hypothetical protein ASARMPREDX12_002766 [Alectoria sarmentosa]
MERHYSTLELVKFDETIGAPERDYDATAFELDTGACAPQVIPDETPQVFYNNSIPEAQGDEESTKKRVPSLSSTKIALKWPWMVTALLVAAVIAVGVAVGIWRHREHSSHNLFPASNKSSPNISITPTAQFILNDTSLAAVSDSDGNRYLFFQDPIGLIRGVIRTDNQWSTNLNLGTSSNAKNYTPLAAIALNDYELNGGESSTITLFYVSRTHALNSSVYFSGSWSAQTSQGDLSQGNFSTEVNTRSLSVAQTGFVPANETSTGKNLALLYYENPTGKVSALSQEIVLRAVTGLEAGESVDGESVSSQWVDITSQESRSLPGYYRNTPGSTAGGYSKTLDESLDSNIFTLSTPFTCGVNSSNDFAVDAIFYSTNASNSEISYNAYTTGPSGAGNFSQMTPFFSSESIPNHLDYSLIHQSDIAVFGQGTVIWINYTNPVIIEGFGSPPLPDNVFPFTRLASFTLADYPFTYLYHQINGTTFAEEQWDDTFQAWTATQYITISYS